MQETNMLNTNLLYLGVAILVAIVLMMLVIKSDSFKAKVTKDGLDVKGNKYSKTVTNIEGITNNANVELKQTVVDNHSSETNVKNVDNAIVKNTVTK